MAVQFLPAPAAVAAMAPQADNSKLAQLYAQLLLKGATSTQPIQSHWEGVNKLAQGMFAGMAMGREAAQNRAAIEGMEALAFPGMSMPKSEQPGLFGDFGKNLGAIFGGSESSKASSAPSTTTLAKALSGDPMGQPSWRDDAMVKFDNPLSAALAGVKPEAAPVAAPVKSGPSAAPQARPSAFDAPQGPIPTTPAVSDQPFGADSVTAQTLRPPANIPQASGTSPIEVAATKLGMHEAVPALRDFLYNDGKNLDPKTRAWCADFVNATLKASGLPGTNSGMARSFLNYGEEAKEPKRGDIAVFSRGDPKGPYGHVGFFDKFADDGSVRVLGGNQGDAVSYQNYPANRLLGFRRPPGGPPSPFNAAPGAVAATGEPAASIPSGIPPMQGQAIQAAVASPGLTGAGGPPVPTPQRMAAPAPSVSQQQPFQVASLGTPPMPQAPAAPPPPVPPVARQPAPQPPAQPVQMAQAPQNAPQPPAIQKQYQEYLDRIGTAYFQERAKGRNANPALLTKLQNLAIAVRAQMMKVESWEPVRDASGNIIGQRNREGKVEAYPKGEKPEYGVIGKDEFGREIYGWKDPRNQKVTPVDVTEKRGAQESTIPPAPPGVDPKVWREEQSKAAVARGLPAKFEDVTKVRKEVMDTPSYKNHAQAFPIYKSMLDTAGRNTRASDLNLVYGLGKIFDPNSVVREGEMVLVKDTAALPDYLVGAINRINGGAALQPDTRKAIMTEAYSRMKAYEDVYEYEMDHYRGIAERARMNVEDVIPKLRRVEPWSPSKDADVWQGQQGAPTPTAPQMFGVPGAAQPQAVQPRIRRYNPETGRIE